MSEYSDPYHYSESSGIGWGIFVIAICAVFSYFMVTSDPTDGLDYASGDTPVEMMKSVCFSDSGPCPPTGFEWRMPASGAIQTRFKREEIHDRTELKGSFRLEAVVFIEEQQEVQDCPALVDWSLLADGKPVAQGTITAGGDQEVTGTLPREAQFIRLTARRTDSLPCHSTFQWLYAGVD
ncbi:hypothetical protein [Spongiactinospora sp. 9N601]|uniref:hypothetical protein n=1 Tax=Spongiactinospora sp. 9N601 TaxID=3375149 RepID=UPI00379CC60D